MEYTELDEDGQVAAEPGTIPGSLKQYGIEASSTLTIVLCQTREGNYTFPSLKDNVLTPLRSDLAFCGSAEESAEDEILNASKYVWNFSEPNNWATACDEISSSDSNWRDLCSFGDAFLGGGRLCRNKRFWTYYYVLA